MNEIENFQGVSGQRLTGQQIQAIIEQIDLDIMNLVKDGKLAAAKYQVGTGQGQMMDRSSGLTSLITARDYYQRLLDNLPVWSQVQAEV